MSIILNLTNDRITFTFGCKLISSYTNVFYNSTSNIFSCFLSLLTSFNNTNINSCYTVPNLPLMDNMVINSKLVYIKYSNLALYDYNFIPRIPINNVYILFNKFNYLFMEFSYIHNIIYQFLIFLLMHSVLFLLYRVLSYFISNIIRRHSTLNLHINTNLLIYIIFSSLIVGASAINPVIQTSVNYIFATIGILLYILVFSLYDYALVRAANDIPLLSNSYLNHLFSGIIYVIGVEIGIFGTNGQWFLTNNYDRNNGPLWYIITFLTGVATSAFWFSLQNMALINREQFPQYQWSVIRGISEVLAFGSVSWNTYESWTYVSSLAIDNFLILSSFLALILHLPFSMLCIYLESIGGQFSTGILYGISYMLQFTGLVFSTNGIIGLISSYMNGMPVQLWTTLLTVIFTAILRPNLYRYNHNTGFRNLLIHTISYFFLALCFIFLGYLLFRPLT